jgi:hypothetical protein
MRAMSLQISEKDLGVRDHPNNWFVKTSSNMVRTLAPSFAGGKTYRMTIDKPTLERESIGFLANYFRVEEPTKRKILFNMARRHAAKSASLVVQDNVPSDQR